MKQREKINRRGKTSKQGKHLQQRRGPACRNFRVGRGAKEKHQNREKINREGKTSKQRKD